MQRTKILLLLVASVGCASPSSFQRAEALAPGRMQWAIETGVFPLPGETRGGVPKLDVTGRYGWTDRLTVGASLGSSGVQLSSKYQFLSGPRVVASLAPSLGAMYFLEQRTTSVVLSLPVLWGVNVGPHQWVFGPRVQDWWYRDPTENRHHLGVGTSVGFSYQVNAQAALLPEVGVLYFPLQSPRGTPLSTSPWLWQLGLGFVLGT